MRTASILLAGLLLSAAALGCDPPPAKAPNPTRTLDERRAIEIIRKAILAEGANPGPARDDTLTQSGKPIRIDVGVEGKLYGIVYVSDDDLATLGSAIDPPNKKDEKLHTSHVGADGKTRIVLLYQTNYRYDDLVGEGHEQTTITSESELARDVRDFVTYARSKKFD